jgi:hypothetical protein
MVEDAGSTAGAAAQYAAFPWFGTQCIEFSKHLVHGKPPAPVS